MTDPVLDQLFKHQTTKTGTVDDIILIVDRSGSMSEILDDAQGGINTFISDQRKVGEAYFTLVQFDYESECLHEQVKLKTLEEEYVLKPRGSTALLDAVGATCGGYEPKGNGKVIIAIVTDGEENSSKEWTRTKLFEMITKKREENEWEFLFLASGQDAIREGTRMGLASFDNVNYNKAERGATKSVYMHASANTTQLRTGGQKLGQADFEAILKDEQSK